MLLFRVDEFLHKRTKLHRLPWVALFCEYVDGRLTR